MNKILLCTDGSAYAQVCCEYGSWLLSRLEDAGVSLLYVSDMRQYQVPLMADLSGSIGVQPYQAILSQLESLESEKAKTLLDAGKSVFEAQGQSDAVTSIHETGFLVDCLKDLEGPYELVMLGKRGENAEFAMEHIGSTIERVARASSKPCLVTSRKFKPVEKVVMAFDGGASCYKSLDFVTRSKLFKGLEVHLVSVPEDRGEDFALKHLKEAESRLEAAGFTPQCHMLPGVPEDVISRYVEDEGMDMLVMGAYGHSRIRQLLIGSTTTEMIRRCRIPVLLFR